MFIYSPQDKVKVYIPLNLNNLLFPGRSMTVFLCCDSCSWVPCWSWAVQLPAVLQKNPPAPADSLVFQHLLHILTLSNSDCMILRPIFSHWGQLRDSYTAITKVGNIYWCSRRQHNALRARGCKLLNRMMSKFFLFCLKIIFFSFGTALKKLHKYLNISQKKK